jgi:hypothetical protein
MFEAEIARGIEALRNADPNFRKALTPDTLHMNGHSDCVLGQWAGGFYIGMDQLFEVSRDTFSARENFWATARNHGFAVCAPRDLRWREVEALYDLLTLEWKAALSK